MRCRPDYLSSAWLADNMRTIIRQWPRLDPRTGVVVFATWAACMGASWALPGDAFHASAMYSALISLGVPERPLGGIALLSAFLMIWSVRASSTLRYRLYIELLCGTFWLLIGAALLIGGYSVGILSPAGAFAVLGGIGSLFSIAQWMANP
jgi:hypothetical protein